MDNSIFREIIKAFIKIAEFKYLAKAITYLKFPDHVL